MGDLEPSGDGQPGGGRPHRTTPVLPPRSWAEERVIVAQGEEGKRIVKVKTHAGVTGNELADYKAKV